MTYDEDLIFMGVARNLFTRVFWGENKNFPFWAAGLLVLRLWALNLRPWKNVDRRGVNRRRRQRVGLLNQKIMLLKLGCDELKTTQQPDDSQF